MSSSFEIPPATLEKLVRLADQANRSAAEFLDLLLTKAEQNSTAQLIGDDVTHQWVMANISDTVFMTRDDGTFTYVCPNIHTIFNYTDDEVWQLGNVQALGLGELYRSEELITVGEIANIDTQVVDKTGKEHHLLVNVKRVGLKQETVLYVCRDNTVRKQMELRLSTLYEEINRYASELEWRVEQRTLELQRKSDQVEAILNHSGDAIAQVNSEGMVEQANLSFYRDFGQIEEARFDSFISHFDPEQTGLLNDALARVFKSGQGQQLEILALRHNHIPFDADVLISPVYGSDQQVISVICSLRDITARKHIEVELRRTLQHEQELNKVHSSFVSTLSHEYRTPLAIILSSSEILLRHIDQLSVERRQQHLDRIRHQIDYMTRVLDDLVSAQKTEVINLDLKTEATDIDGFCQTVMLEVQSSVATHQLEYSARGECGTVLLDKKLMRQVIYNLLSNAMKYSPPGSLVSIDLECHQTHIHLRVKDQGIGIPADDLEHLFEIFYRAQNVGTIQGTGLGLPIIKRAIEAHGGRVTVESQVNKGTVFTIVLPREVNGAVN